MGSDWRRQPIEERKRLLGQLLRGAHLSIVLKRDRLPRGLQARLRGYCVEVPWLTLPLRALAALGEGQKPECASRQGGGPRGLELTDS